MFLQQLLSCIPGFGDDYVALSKRDDDYGVEQVAAWKVRFPLEQRYRELGYETVEDYCKEMVRAIKPIPYNHTTTQQIGEHLAKLAIRSNAVYQHLLEQLNMFNGTFLRQDFRLALSGRVIKVTPEAE